MRPLSLFFIIVITRLPPGEAQGDSIEVETQRRGPPGRLLLTPQASTDSGCTTEICVSNPVKRREYSLDRQANRDSGYDFEHESMASIASSDSVCATWTPETPSTTPGDGITLLDAQQRVEAFTQQASSLSMLWTHCLKAREARHQHHQWNRERHAAWPPLLAHRKRLCQQLESDFVISCNKDPQVQEAVLESVKAYRRSRQRFISQGLDISLLPEPHGRAAQLALKLMNAEEEHKNSAEQARASASACKQTQNAFREQLKSDQETLSADIRSLKRHYNDAIRALGSSVFKEHNLLSHHAIESGYRQALKELASIFPRLAALQQGFLIRNTGCRASVS